MWASEMQMKVHEAEEFYNEMELISDLRITIADLKFFTNGDLVKAVLDHRDSAKVTLKNNKPNFAKARGGKRKSHPTGVTWGLMVKGSWYVYAAILTCFDGLAAATMRINVVMYLPFMIEIFYS